MDYSNPYGMTTNPLFVPQPAQALPKTRIKQVNGRQGAEAYQMAPGSSDILMDTTAPLIYVVVTDDAGFKTVTAFDVAKHEEPQPADVNALTAKIDSFEKALARIEEKFEELMR